jgi:hypothetical protein
MVKPHRPLDKGKQRSAEASSSSASHPGDFATGYTGHEQHGTSHSTYNLSDLHYTPPQAPLISYYEPVSYADTSTRDYSTPTNYLLWAQSPPPSGTADLKGKSKETSSSSGLFPVAAPYTDLSPWGDDHVGPSSGIPSF